MPSVKGDGESCPIAHQSGEEVDGRGEHFPREGSVHLDYIGVTVLLGSGQ